MNEIALNIRQISKRFPGVQALDAVSFDVMAGEVHALCGENGAGKSTLMKILSGRIQPDSGEILYYGTPYAPASPRDAKEAGLILLHQEISLVPDLTVAENICLGALPLTRLGLVDRQRTRAETRAVLEQVGLDVSPDAVVETLSIANQQLVEIARAAARPYRVVIFDEPTATLSELDAQRVYALVRKLKQVGVAVIYISHKMDEVFSLSDRITVLRDGTIRSTLSTADTCEHDILKLMIGREIQKGAARRTPHRTDELLRVDALNVHGFDGQVSFAVHCGEVLGIYGLVGAGRSELADAIFGLRKTTGTIRWEGQVVRIRHPWDAQRLGLGYVPEDRKRQGLVLTHSIENNIILASLGRVSARGLLRRARARTLFKDYAQRLGIKPPRPRAIAEKLSGGNQQKVVLAKWMATRPKLLILDEPTRGVDVGAKAEIHALISELAAHSIAIVLISSELPEIIRLSDRIVTLREGELTGEFAGASITEDAIFAAAMKPEPRTRAQLTTKEVT